MKALNTFLLTIFLTASLAACAQEPVDSRQKEIVFQDVSVIPMDKEHVLEGRTVVVKGGKIIFIGEFAKAKYGKDALIVNGKGKYLIPGLAEMHAHVPQSEELDPMKEVLMLFAAHGITSIRGMQGHPQQLELRKKLQQGEVIGPHFYPAGPGFSGQSVNSPAEAAEMVRQQKQDGYDFLKIFPGLTLEEFDAMARTAKEVKIPFVGHVPADVGAWRAIDAGYSSIDHLDGFIEGMVPGIEKMDGQQTGLFGMFVAEKADTSQIPKLMNALKSKNIWVVPTQALAERWFSPASVEQFLQAPEMIYMTPEQRTNWANSKKSIQSNPQYDAAKIDDYIKLRRRLIAHCQQNGVGLLLGVDAPQVFNVPGYSTHHELEYLVNSGLSPFEALQTGTVNVARYLTQYKLNEPEQNGTVSIGAASDLLLLNGNPLADIKQTRNIEGVFLGNLWLNKEYIQKELKKLEKK
jgi:imidazolonepropionase-like amidohydrolase